MDFAVIITCGVFINIIAVVAYSAKLAGAITGRLATALALMNVLLLISRLANAAYAPLLSKRVEDYILAGNLEVVEIEIRVVLLASFVGALIGALIVIPSAKILVKWVHEFSVSGLYGSSYKGLRGLFSFSIWRESIHYIRNKQSNNTATEYGVSRHFFFMNTLMYAVWSVGTLSAILAGALHPEYRATAIHLSALINGIATLILYLYCDPFFAKLVDDAKGESSEHLQKVVKIASKSHALGVLLGQLLLFPAALLIASAAKVI